MRKSRSYYLFIYVYSININREICTTETNVKCGLTALRGCLKGNLEQPVDLKHLREALVCYNGKGKNAEIYADKVLKKLLELYVSSAFDSKSNVTLKQK